MHGHLVETAVGGADERAAPRHHAATSGLQSVNLGYRVSWVRTREVSLARARFAC